MKHPVFFGNVENGKLTLDTPDLYEMYLGTLNGRVRVDIGSHRKNRSLEQNAYYWGVCLTLASDNLGYTTEELHDTFKAMFLKDRIIRQGRWLEIVRSTSNLDTKEMTNYIENVRRELAQLGIFVPSPKEL